MSDDVGRLGGFGFGRPAFSRAWYVDGGVDGDIVDISVSPGFVNGYQPFINGQPIGGRSGAKPPRLRKNLKFDVYGRSYISIRAKVNPNTGLMPNPPTADDLIIDVTDIRAREEQPIHLGIWYQPIAIVHHTGFIERICYFDLQHWTAFIAGSGTRYFPYHFFSVT